MKEKMKNTLLFKGGIAKSITLSVMVAGLFMTSCAEDVLEENPTTLEETQLQTIALAPRNGEMAFIEAKSGDSFDALKGRATDAAGDDRGRFNISLKFLLPPTERQEQVFNDAAERWERIIIGDVPSIVGPIPSAFSNFPDAVAEGEILDDIVIEVALAPIDGPGGILGQAGPNFVRTADFLTISGVMFFDVADLDFLEQLDLFEEVIVHEMGHVLGVGTLWNVAPFGFDRTLRQGSDDDPFFAGRKANVFWNAEGGTGELPIEGDFGPGTRFGHWDEEALDNELMTGFLNLGENPLSRITAGSMRDLGYRSASVGESYDLPRGTEGVDASESAADGAGIQISEMETLLQPVGFVSVSNKK